jgi:hypothetical protein
MTDASAPLSPTAASAEWLSGLAPNAIGATGGSGTRVVGRIVREAGLFTGTNLNNYEDALDFGGFSDRWINTFAPGGMAELPEDVRAEMTDDLAAVVETHRRELPSDDTPWGWKEPRSIYLLSFYDALMPQMKFLHFMRDGRDMAFSENQQQLKKHGEVVLSPDESDWKRPVQSIALWSRVNSAAADYGEQHMPGRYLLVRFEELCGDPRATVGRIFAFFGLDADVEQAASAVRPPDTLGRWQKARKKTVAQLHEVASPALERFGYLESS